MSFLVRPVTRSAQELLPLRLMFHIFTVLALLAAPLSAQAASFTTFGNPCSLAPPSLAAQTLPRIGSDFVLETSTRGIGGYEGRGTTFVAVGGSNTSWAGVPLPWNPSTLASLIGAVGCGDLAISLDLVLTTPISSSAGPVQLVFGIPNDASVIGTTLFFQPFIVEPNRRGFLALSFGLAGEARVGT